MDDAMSTPTLTPRLQGRELIIPWNAGSDLTYLRDREWLITNGLGGYASGTLAGMPSRKYHGLFVPNLASPKGRHIMISRCDEFVIVGDKRVHLGGAEFVNDLVVGESHRHLTEFRLDHRTAIWRFEVGGSVIEKSILMPHNQNTVCVRYRLLRGEPVDLHVRPYTSFRRHDEQPEQDLTSLFTLTVQQSRHEVHLSDSPLVLRMAMQPGPAAFVTDERAELEFFYRVEFDRGDPHLESAFSPGYFMARVTHEQPAVFVASTQSWASLQFNALAVFEAETRRCEMLLSLAPELRQDPFAEQLAMAADQFIVLPGSRFEETVIAQAEGNELRTVIAGYHWFGDWGRDTMISLEGLTLCTGRYREAGAILRTFAKYVRDGLLPNLFPEGERQALYHTVDATLWYFHAVSRYVEATGDRSIIEQLFPILHSIIEHYLQGTHYNIGVDPSDGLVAAGADGYQLTWMDAKVDDWVVTPRRGKPVEIQALWYNALNLMAAWAADLGKPNEFFQVAAANARETFNRRYWNEGRGCLFDVIDGPDGDDPALRPNQIFAISLSHPILEQRHWAAVVDTLLDRLVTPYGVRTLSSDHPEYKSHYRGNLRERDAAYHQGTVWPWLIGHLIDAYLKVRPDRTNARRLLQGFHEHLFDAGIGSISEIFDAEEPFRPGGCIAQAWSVAEVLRAWLKTRAWEDSRLK
jgi:predicted glycogen debranching enzyme